ncbi:MAG: helix-turn-helix domain-containing protein [Schwartzia sp.]|nr:helix-turn-helix domain-containing protein [Schwartzia sp. (in: firmicutes)]
MAKDKRLTTAERWRVVAEFAEGAKMSALAAKYDVSRWTIYRLLKRYEETGKVSLDFDRCGRKSKLTEAQKEAVREALVADPDADLQALLDRLALPCTLRALYYIVKQMGFRRGAKRERIKLTRPVTPPDSPEIAPRPVWKGRAYLWR